MSRGEAPGAGWRQRLAALARRHGWALGLAAAALAVRLAYVSWGIEVPPQDTADYDEIARSLLAGDGFVARTNWFGHPMRSWRAPLYPWFLALVYGVFGYSHLAVKLAQAALGAATVLLVYGLARRLHPRAAPLAGAVAAVYGPLVGCANEVMTEALFTLCFTGGAYLAVTCTAPRCREPRLLALGAVAGAAALARPVGLLVWPAILAVWVLQGPTRWAAGGPARRAWGRRAAWMTAGVVLVIAPWTLRNAVVHRAFVPISTHGGFIFARSNGADPDWRRDAGWRIEARTFEEIPSEVERDRYWFRQGVSEVRADPTHYLRLSGERFLRFWYFLRPDYNLWYMLVLPFFAAGLARYGLTPGYSLLAAAGALSLGAFTFALYGSTRFRLPLEPLFIVFAAAFVRDLWDRRRAVAAGWVGAAVAVNALALWQQEALRRGLGGLLAGWGLK